MDAESKHAGVWRPRVAVVTNMPSYHQVDLFNAIAASGRVRLHVLYLRRMTPGRQWSRLGGDLRHDHTFVREWRVHPHFYLNPGFRTAFDRLRPDLTVVTQYASIAMQWLMIRETFRRRPWVFWSEIPGVEHTEQPIVRSERLRRLLRTVALLPVRLGAREVWAIGSVAATAYRKRFPGPVRVLPYFADLERFRTLPPPADGGPVRFLFLGKLNRRKGADVLIASTRELLRERTRFLLDIAGDGPLRREVEELAGSAPDRVRYLGFRQLDQIPEVLSRCDVLVCPSRFDGWGMVVPEAMAAGRPVIATSRTMSAADLVQTGGTGWLVEPGEVDPLTTVMRRAAADPVSVRSRTEEVRRAAAPMDARPGAERFLRHALELCRR